MRRWSSSKPPSMRHLPDDLSTESRIGHHFSRSRFENLGTTTRDIDFGPIATKGLRDSYFDVLSVLIDAYECCGT